MIKMIIGGEEVVSNKEFTINEEMLSASSTILNNCYPKSWEDNKDYTSNFYYPKDYSKFLLGEGEFLHGITEYSMLKTSGNNQANYNEFILRRISFDNSTGIYSASDNDNASLLEMKMQQWSDTSTFIQGTQVQKTVSSLGRITLTGTIVENCNYIRIGNNGRSYEFAIIMPKPSDFNIGDKFTVSFDIIDMTIGACKIKYIQLEKGEVATNYSPFGEYISYETNVEKEWNNFNVYGSTYQKTRSGINLLNVTSSTTTTGGITFTVNDDKSITVNGTNTSGGTIWYRLAPNFVLPAGSYTLSNGNSNVNNDNGFIFIDDDNNFARKNISNATFTSNTTIKPYIKVSSGYTVNNQTIYPMIIKGTYLESGTNLPDYEQYGAMPSPDYPSELISVGYENLLDLSYLASQTINGVTITNNNGVITLNGTSTTGFAITTNHNIILSAGTYTHSVNQIKSGIYLSLNNVQDTMLYGSLNNLYKTFTISEETTYPTYLIFINSNITFNNFIIRPQLTKGSQAHSYIPYGKYGIELNNFGKNSFDESQLLNAVGWSKNNNGYYYGLRDRLYRNFRSENGGFKFNFKFKENTQYTISFIAYASVNSGNPRFEIRYTDGTIQSSGNWNTTTPIKITRTTFANKTIASISYGYGSGGGTTDYLKDIQLEENTHATTYEEYKSNSQLYILDEPLRSVGNISDKLYIDFGYLYVERKIGKKIYNGSENWSTPWSNTRYVYQCTDAIEDSKRQSSASSNIICQSNYYPATHYDGETGSIWNLRANDNYPYLIALGDAVPNSAGKVFVKNFDISNVNDFKSWLSTHNIEMNYILNESKIEIIGTSKASLPNSYNGINNVSLNSGLDTSMEVYYYWKNFNVLFAGVVKNTGDISLNPRYPHYCNLQILDYKTFLSESNTLDFVIANKTVKEAIGMVVNAISGYGFILGEVNIDSADDIIGAYSTLNKTAYDVLQYLANISGSRWRARYVDSSTMAIDFYDPDTLPQGANIEYTQEYWENNNIVDLTFNYGTRDYRNKQILLSDEVYANINYNETLISNGYTNTFTLQNNIGTVVNILVGNEEKTVATTNDKQMGIDADFYYAPGKNIIESNSVYSAGTLIKITYQPLVKGRQIVYNTNEVDRISTQTDTEGIIARYENRNDILSSDELEKIAQTYIEYKGKAEVILTLTTRNNDLYNIGEVVYFDAPIPDLAQNYMVKTKKTEYIVIDEIVNLFYIYEMTSSFNSEKAINYFDNQRNKASGNIAEGDSITRNIDIETDVAIIWTGGTVSSASITVDGDNVLNSVLNSPFVE